MSQSDLPPEISERPLSFSELIETLELVDGESVIVRLDAADGVGQPAAGLASMVGELRRHEPARYPGHEFSIGSPYPDREPACLGGGVLFLDEATYQSTTLSTFDANDYFMIQVRTRALQILIQSSDSTYP